MAGLDGELLAELAECALEQGSPYLFSRTLSTLIELPASRENSRQNNGRWISTYFKALLKLGMTDCARGLLRQIQLSNPDFGAAIHDLDRSSALHDLSGSRIPWSSRKRRFEANLAAMRQQSADSRNGPIAPAADLADQIEAAWRESAAAFELHRSSDGVMHVCPAGRYWPPAWVEGLEDHRAQAERILGHLQLKGLLPPPILLIGVGLGGCLVAVAAKTHRTFLEADSAIYMIEPRLERIAIALHLHDLRPLLLEPRVYWFAGKDAEAQFEAFLLADHRRPIPAQRFLIDGAPGREAIEAALTRVSRKRVEDIQRIRTRLLMQHEHADAAHWARRFSLAINEQGARVDTPLRILGITSRHTTFLQYSMRDCLAALNALGHETQLLIDPSNHQPLDALSMLKAQEEFRPDLVLLLSRMRDEMSDLIHAAIPTVAWDQDALPWVFHEDRRPRLAWNDFLMGFSALNAAQRFGWPAHRCLPCAMAASSALDSPTDGRDHPHQDEPSFQCDLSYVSHASAAPEEELSHAARWLSDATERSLFYPAAETMLALWRSNTDFPGPVMTTLLNLAEEKGIELSDGALDRLCRAVGRIGDRQFRHEALTWTAEWADANGRVFELWGRGWEKHPRLAAYARGPIENGDRLSELYRRSRINLQLMGYGFIHQRALDGILAGGFFMARKTLADTIGAALRRLEEECHKHGVKEWCDAFRIPDRETREWVAEMLRRMSRDPRRFSHGHLVSLLAERALPRAPEILPHFDRITFDSPESFAALAECYLADDPLRRRITRDLRKAVKEHFGYERRMKDMLAFVRRGLLVEARRAPRPEENALQERRENLITI